MAQALYRKWRPLNWDQVVGQEHVVQTLRNAVVAERVAERMGLSVLSSPISGRALDEGQLRR